MALRECRMRQMGGLKEAGAIGRNMKSTTKRTRPANTQGTEPKQWAITSTRQRTTSNASLPSFTPTRPHSIYIKPAYKA